MNSKQIGNITELECMLAFIKQGYNVLIPYGDCERYDFVADINGVFYKIQSKTSHSDDNGASFQFSCRSCNRSGGKIQHHTYNKEEIDYFSTIFNGKCYLIPISEAEGKTSFRFRYEYPSSGQKQGIHLAEEYELEKQLQRLEEVVE